MNEISKPQTKQQVTQKLEKNNQESTKSLNQSDIAIIETRIRENCIPDVMLIIDPLFSKQEVTIQKQSQKNPNTYYDKVEVQATLLRSNGSPEQLLLSFFGHKEKLDTGYFGIHKDAITVKKNSYSQLFLTIDLEPHHLIKLPQSIYQSTLDNLEVSSS